VNEPCSDEWNHMPLMLTVEEAARVLRIGRSHAYNLARMYFASGGTHGLPVLRLGNVMRVPKIALYELVTTGHVMQLIAPAPAIASERAADPRTQLRATRATSRSQLSLLGSD